MALKPLVPYLVGTWGVGASVGSSRQALRWLQARKLHVSALCPKIGLGFLESPFQALGLGLVAMQGSGGVGCLGL